MDESFRIYVDQLRDGKKAIINEVLDPAFLRIDEPELAFKKKILVTGEAYLASSDLILHLNAEAEALIPCLICNDPVPTYIGIEGFYYTQPVSEIKSGVFSFEELLREIILIEVPFFAECHEGQCPHRSELAKYMKSTDEKHNRSEETYHPFSDLEL